MGNDLPQAKTIDELDISKMRHDFKHAPLLWVGLVTQHGRIEVLDRRDYSLGVALDLVNRARKLSRIPNHARRHSLWNRH